MVIQNTQNPKGESNMSIMISSTFLDETGYEKKTLITL